MGKKVGHFEIARLPRNVGHQLHSGLAPHFSRMEASLNVVIGGLHSHVGERKMHKIFITNSQGKEFTMET
jgi:hypothetical protein